MTGYCDSAINDRRRPKQQSNCMSCPALATSESDKVNCAMNSIHRPSNVVVAEKMFGATHGGSKQQYLFNETEKPATIKSTRTDNSTTIASDNGVLPERRLGNRGEGRSRRNTGGKAKGGLHGRYCWSVFRIMRVPDVTTNCDERVCGERSRDK
eukprot:CAMPEP_0113478916 /NCGR_PEP_ID=MMETSP0014_2-20120614/21016_1 /TAXON_ID=2857 /ORGANISM="Nitzschia sp." /LENGTH=153 /DNA_ID=CAMNT_0000372149 /DNA_START=104 /DNA_END=565 /DNA_ORIENTATION=- /assembly_acc=CAM_ASM_000159